MTDPHTPLGPPLLTVAGLTVGYRVRGRVRPTVTDVSFTVPDGATLALVGESGSGKSTVAGTVLRLGAPNAVVESGTVRYRGESLLTLGGRRLRELRGNEIAYVPQDPANSLNPVRTIGSQLTETLRATGSTDEALSARVVELLDAVGIPRPAEVARKYPHQLSGGMLQRAILASAIAAGPRLLVADEPTSALDVTVQRRVLDLIDRLRVDLGLGVLLITHDLALAKERCDHLVVLEHGRVREAGKASAVLHSPRSDYTRRLLADVPALNADKFGRPASDGPAGSAPPAIALEGVTKVFARPGGRDGRTGGFLALDDVTLRVARGTTHAIVGESGSGKTTLARLILGLERPTSGRVLVDGEVLDPADPAALRRARRRIQLVYQNPSVALDPGYTAARAVAEPLLRHGIGTRATRARRARELLRLVGLPEHTYDALPVRLSGGQRQRVAIARALALEPEVLVLDEPTSALDVTVQARILELIVDLQRELGSTYVLISHDLGVVRQVADEVTVLRHGVVVESGRADAIFTDPADDYTRDLIESVPGWAYAGDHAAAAEPVPARI
ncbi:dipeptide ABC transporter ATP-binding protein [Nocardia higoensis]|uniref:dipeptide ABC transporter ATP-binding protein n=1 Tax=Nocardia higoensis TaxID=228599 RepID=UPI0002F04F45|nr:ABC transporter ATP-binding protein [Nocardia higoensis]